MILDESTRHIDEFNIDCSVEDLLQVISTSWEHLLPDGAILSLSYHGRRASRGVVIYVITQWNLLMRIPV